jgi:hypothetical protein
VGFWRVAGAEALSHVLAEAHAFASWAAPPPAYLAATTHALRLCLLRHFLPGIAFPMYASAAPASGPAKPAPATPRAGAAVSPFERSLVATLLQLWKSVWVKLREQATLLLRSTTAVASAPAKVDSKQSALLALDLAAGRGSPQETSFAFTAAAKSDEERTKLEADRVRLQGEARRTLSQLTEEGRRLFALAWEMLGVDCEQLWPAGLSVLELLTSLAKSPGLARVLFARAEAADVHKVQSGQGSSSTAGSEPGVREAAAFAGALTVQDPWSACLLQLLRHPWLALRVPVLALCAVRPGQPTSGTLIPLVTFGQVRLRCLADALRLGDAQKRENPRLNRRDISSEDATALYVGEDDKTFAPFAAGLYATLQSVLPVVCCLHARKSPNDPRSRCR